MLVNIIHRNKKKDFLFVYFLIIPIISRWLFLDTWEILLTFDFIGYPLFLPEILFFCLPFVSTSSNDRFLKLTMFACIGIIYVFLGCYANDIDSIYFNMLGGSDFFVTTLIVSLFPVAQRHIQIIKWPLLVCLILLGLEVILFSTVLRYDGIADESSLEGGVIRISTTVGAATGTGVILFMLTILSYTFINRNRFYRLAILLFGTICIFFTLSRGAIIVHLCFLLFAFIKELGSLKYRKLWAYFILLLFLIISFIIVNEKFKILDSVFNRVELKSDGSDYSSGRFDRYKLAFDLIKDNPLIGHGSCSMISYTRANKMEYVQSLNTYSPHNFYLLFLVDYGIIGLLIFLIILRFFLKLAFNKVRLNELNVSFLLLILITMNVEVVFFTMNYLLLFYLLAQFSRFRFN